MSLTAWRAFGKNYYLFVRLKSIAGLQLLGAMTGLIKEVINRSSGGPQGGGAEMGGGKREKKIKIISDKIYQSLDAWYFKDILQQFVCGWFSSDHTVLIVKSWGTQLILRDTQWPLLANPLLISCCTNFPQVGFNLFCSVSHQLVLTMVNFRSVPHCSRPRVWVFQLFLEPWKLSRLKYCTFQCVAEANKVQTIKVDLSWQLIHIQTQG